MGFRWRASVDAIVTALVVIAAGLVIYKNYPATSKPVSRLAVPSAPVSLEGATLVGDRNATAGLIVYTDFLCLYCKAFGQQMLPFLQEKYVQTGLLLLIVRQFPIDKLHPFASRAAEAAVCGARQNKFMVIHDTLFAHQRQLAEEELGPLTLEAGLNADTFHTCLGGQATDAVKQDLAGGLALNVTATPSFFLGRLTRDGRLAVTRTVVGAKLSREEWQSAVEDVLNAARSDSRWVLYGIAALVLVGLAGFLRLRRAKPEGNQASA